MQSRSYRFALSLATAATLALGLLPAAAQDTENVPSVTVRDQFVSEGVVVIDSAYSSGPGFIVLHQDQGGQPGPVVGYAPVSPGMNTNVMIMADSTLVTPLMFAMLHADDGAVGTYEFDGQSGLDNPASVDGAVVTPSFNVQAINIADQFPVDNTITVTSVTTDAAGWLVVHTDNGGAPGPVIGQTLLASGTTANVVIDIDPAYNNFSLWPMLHVDTGEAGVYEFGSVEGADSPIAVDGAVATVQAYTVPHMRVQPQVVLQGDNTPTLVSSDSMTFTADSVLSQGPGWLVVHIDNAGAPGPVAGYAQLNDGVNLNVVVPLDQGVELTSTLWPMMHVDDGALGTYEFDGQSGLDNPVSVMEVVQTEPIEVAPGFMYLDQSIVEGTLTVDWALIDAPGWLVIHANEGGAPGTVLAQVPLHAGLNRNIVIPLDGTAAGTGVFPMLHYDTNEMGVYEFGTVDGADGPVVVGGNVVVAPLSILSQ